MFINNKNSDIKKKKKESALLKTFMEVLYKVMGFQKILEGIVFTKIEVFDKGGRAIISVYSHDSEDQAQAAIKKIISYSKQIQHQIGQILQYRYTPKLEFIYDAQYEKILKINKLLTEIKENE
jgi:ribosome-binding factor A